MSASRGNPQPQHYYAITGGSRAVNLPFKPAQKQAPHKLVPRPKVGDPLKSYAVASRVLADGTIMPAPGPSEWNKRATARRAVTTDSLVASTQSAWAASQAEPLPTSKRADGNFSTEYSRSFATPVRLSSPLAQPSAPNPAQPTTLLLTLLPLALPPQRPDATIVSVGMPCEKWAKDDGCIYKASPMVCRDNCAPPPARPLARSHQRRPQIQLTNGMCVCAQTSRPSPKSPLRAPVSYACCHIGGNRSWLLVARHGWLALPCRHPQSTLNPSFCLPR